METTIADPQATTLLSQALVSLVTQTPILTVFAFFYFKRDREYNLMQKYYRGLLFTLLQIALIFAIDDSDKAKDVISMLQKTEMQTNDT